MLDFNPVVSVNGRIDSSLVAHDRGLNYGDGLFETLIMQNSVLPFIDIHMSRLNEGVARLQIDFDQKTLSQYISHLLLVGKERGVEEAVLKIVVTRGVAGRGYQPSITVPATIILGLYPIPLIPESFYSQGVNVFVCDYRLPKNKKLAGIKHLNKLDYVLASLEWRDQDFQEGLLFDSDNNLVEANSRNVFLLSGGKLFTPSLESSGVAGTLRRMVIEKYANFLNIEVIEKQLSLESLLTADEVFLCNSVTGFWPVKAIMGSEIQQTGMAAQLQQLFQDDIHARVGANVA